MKKAFFTIFTLLTFSLVANAQYYGYPLEMIFGGKKQEKVNLDVKLGDPLLTHSNTNTVNNSSQKEEKKRKRKERKAAKKYNEAHDASSSSGGLVTTFESFADLILYRKKSEEEARKTE